MVKQNQVYKCEICGNIVEVLHAGGGTLVCCNQDMNLQIENSEDAAQEKHVPVIKKDNNGYTVVVGSVAHPMVENHFIQWIELIDGDNVYRKFLKPGEQPEAFFNIASDNVFARAYCNIHGFWKS